MIIDTNNLLNVISTQFADIINKDLEYYRDYKIIVSEEQMFFKDDDDLESNHIYIVVKFLQTIVDYNQTSIPIVVQCLSEMNGIEIARKLLYSFAIDNNLKWNEDGTMQQVWHTPEVVANFVEVFEGFSSTLSMAGAALIVKNGNNCKIEYKPFIILAPTPDKETGEIKYFRIAEKEYEDVTQETRLGLDINTLKHEINEAGEYKFEYNGLSWTLKKNGRILKKEISTLNNYGIDYSGEAQEEDYIIFELEEDYKVREIKYFRVIEKEYEDVTEVVEPEADISTLRNKINEAGEYKFEYNGLSWTLEKEGDILKQGIPSLYDYGITYHGYAREEDYITFELVKGYQEIEALSINSAAHIALDSQSFYNNDNFTKSKGKFGSFSINITTYLFDNEFLNKCLAIYLRDLVKEPLGIDTEFEFRITFTKSSHQKELVLKLADFSLSENKGELPVVSLTFTE